MCGLNSLSLLAHNKHPYQLAEPHKTSALDQAQLSPCGIDSGLFVVAQTLDFGVIPTQQRD